jgi:hypothetical protein
MKFSLSVLDLVTKSNLIKSMFFNLPIILPPIFALAVYVNRETFSLFSNFFRAICNPWSLIYFFFSVEIIIVIIDQITPMLINKLTAL